MTARTFSVTARGCDALHGVATGPRAVTDTPAAAVVSSPTIPSGAAQAHVQGDETTGTARVLLEQTAPVANLPGVGSTPTRDRSSSRVGLLDGERDNAQVFAHPGVIRTSA